MNFLKTLGEIVLFTVSYLLAVGLSVLPFALGSLITWYILFK